MGSRGIRGQKTPDVKPLPTKERVLFMQRLLGKYYAEKGYAVKDTATGYEITQK